MNDSSRGVGASPGPAGAFTVPTPDAFSFRSTALSHGWVLLAPFTWDEEEETVERIGRLGDGGLVRMRARASPEDEALEVEVQVERPGEGAPGRIGEREREAVAAILRRIFNLELDLEPFYELLRDEKGYAWVEERGAGRLLRAPTVWEDLAKTLLTTNTTWAGTTGMVERLCGLGEPLGGEKAGAPLAGSGGGAAGGAVGNLPRPCAFPTPERVAELDPEELDGRVRAGYRSEYLHELASRISRGELDVEAWAVEDPAADELYDRIRSLRGFGPYAAGSVCKLLGAFDRLALDSATRAAYARIHNDGEPAPDAEIRAHYEPYGEWRGLVIWMDTLRAYAEREEEG